MKTPRINNNRFYLCIVLPLFVAAISLGGALWAQSSQQTTVGQKYPGLTMGILQHAVLKQLPKGTLLKAGDISITESDLAKLVKNADPEIQGQLKRNLIFVLEQDATRRILLEEAKKAGYKSEGSDSQTVMKFLNDKASSVTVTDEELKQFYTENKSLLGGASFKDVKDSLRNFILAKKRQQVVFTYVNTLMDNTPIEINSKWVDAQAPIMRDNPVDKARFSGKPTMVEFGASGCRPCEMMQPIVEDLRKKYSKQMNVVFLHVRENPILAARFGVSAIPVQVFYDKEGKEVFRHVGYFPEKEVLKKIEQIGIKTKE